MAWLTKDPELFGGGPQVENFRRMGTIHPSRRIERARAPHRFADARDGFVLPDRFACNGEMLDTQAFLESVTTTGLLVLHRGDLVHAQNWHGYAPDTQASIFSCTKSFVSSLVSIALHEGAIGSVEDPVDRYAPELQGSGYAGVRLHDVLNMSSGVRWNEDYGDPQSDVARFAGALAGGPGFDSVCASLPREFAPGTFNRYNSCDTHVLGMVLVRATGMALADYLQRSLWEPLGMEDDAFLAVDATGMEAAGMGLSVSLRDMAKLGELMRCDGRAPDGRQLLRADWADACATATAPHLKPGRRATANYPWGYAYQWWLPDESGVFSALGVYHQMIWVDRANDVVIAKTTAHAPYGQDHDEEELVDRRHFALCHAIGAAATAQRG